MVLEEEGEPLHQQVLAVGGLALEREVDVTETRAEVDERVVWFNGRGAHEVVCGSAVSQLLNMRIRMGDSGKEGLRREQHALRA